MSATELPFGGLVLSPAYAAAVALMEPAVRAWWRGKGLETPAAQADVLAAAQRQMEALRARRNGQGFAPRPVAVSPIPSPRFAATECSYLLTEQVAVRLKISPQRVRTLVRKGQLAGVRSGEGHGAHWLISEESVTAWETKRDARGHRRAA